MEEDPILSSDDLAEYQRQLSLLSDAGVEQEYQRSWQASQFDGKRAPPAAAVQQMVAAWRVLRPIHKRR
jgi:hypothetical protein